MNAGFDSFTLNSDLSFNKLLPDYLRSIAGIQFTSFEVSLKVADFLAHQPGSKVLDIGSGTGKFCLIAATRYPESEFIGIEQRKDLFETSIQLAKKLRLPNVHFKLGNVIEHNLDQYNRFYFYNSFHENLVFGNGNDLAYSDEDEAEFDADQFEEDFSTDRYLSYSEKLRLNLSSCKPGSRLVTYHSSGLEVPDNYELVDQKFGNKLKFWVKKSFG